MMSKEQVRLARVASALHRVRQQICGSLLTQDCGLEYAEADSAFEETVRSHHIENDVHHMRYPLLQAEAVAQALAMRLSQWGPVENAALEHLALVLSVPLFIEHRFQVTTSFRSASFTYEGPFEDFKRDLRFGLCYDASGGLHRTYGEFHLTVLKQDGLVFERAPETPGGLNTFKVSGDLAFEVVLVSEDVEVCLDAMLREIRVGIGYTGLQSAPSQRVALELPRVTEHVVR